MTGPSWSAAVLGLASAVGLRTVSVSPVAVIGLERRGRRGPAPFRPLRFGLRGLRTVVPARATPALRELAEEEGVEVLVETMVTDWEGVRALKLTARHGAGARATRVVLETGCRERPRSARLVPGSRPAGSMTTATPSSSSTSAIRRSVAAP